MAVLSSSKASVLPPSQKSSEYLKLLFSCCVEIFILGSRSSVIWEMDMGEKLKKIIIIKAIHGNEETICGWFFLNDGCLKVAQQFGMQEAAPVELRQRTRVEVRRQKNKCN